MYIVMSFSFSLSCSYSRCDHQVIVLKVRSELEIESEVLHVVDELIERQVDSSDPDVIVSTESQDEKIRDKKKRQRLL